MDKSVWKCRRVSKALLCAGSLIAVLLTAQGAFGNAITGTAGSGWQPFPNPLHEQGNPYWDHASWDGPQDNVGHILSGQAGVTPPWWGNANGSADLNFYFTRSGSMDALMYVALAGRAGVNELGWYDIASPGVLHPIFPGGTAPGTTAFVNPSATYGFYFQTLEDGAAQVYYTQSFLNPAGETHHQHFAVFAQSLTPGSEIYWLGMEDLRLHSSDRDYQDMIARVRANPEPSTFILLGGGLLTFLFRRRWARLSRG